MSFILVDKPAGIATHATETGLNAPVGFVEYLSNIANQKLYVVHRLDKGTTGALVFALNEKSAAELSEAFATRTVEKKYLFISDKPIPASTEFTVGSFIEKRGGKFVSEKENPNAETTFRLLLTNEPFSLWEARPLTGKPHQIRLHAQDSGIPVLGDTEHGGTPFPSVCLHSAELKFSVSGVEHTHQSDPPLYFSDLNLLINVPLCGWLANFDRRSRWLVSRTEAARSANRSDLIDLNCWRALHTESEKLRAEVLGEVTDLQWFSDESPSTEDWDDINALLKLTHARSWRLHLRNDRGKKPLGEKVWSSQPHPPARWYIHENGLRFEARSDTGLSSGLFLDQRANRQWVKENSKDKTILNLFCYTSGFSVAAVRGDATKTVNVDLSKNFLEWSKMNFSLNGIPVASHEFRAMDAREYLKYARKKSLSFDLVICDPPSFSRGDKGVFQLEKELGDILRQLSEVTAQGGAVLFCTNFEGWHGTHEFRIAVGEEIKKQKLPLTFDTKKWPELPPADLDFEMPGEPRLMKALLLEKT
jgi:23S rRNA (cytosine1962-C5)-methyltransferase